MNTIFHSKKITLKWIVAVCWILSGCATIDENHSALPPAPRPDYLVNEYTANYTYHSVETKEGPMGSTRVVLNVPKEDPILINWFRSEGDQPKPALIVSPILGGKNRIANHFAKYFSEHGYHSMVVHRPEDLKEDIYDAIALDKSLKKAVMRDRIALDWLQRQPGVDPNALGSFGISYGGIKNTILAGVDKRLKANIFGLAGAEMATILSQSNLENLAEGRIIAMEKNGWNLPEFEQDLQSKLRTEPLRFTPYIDPKTTFLILARMDHTVPRKNGELLREALREPKTMYLPTGHYSGALFTGIAIYPYIENKALAFFDKHLKPYDN